MGRERYAGYKIISPTDMSERATSVTEQTSLADRLYKAASFFIPRSNRTHKTINLSTLQAN